MSKALKAVVGVIALVVAYFVPVLAPWLVPLGASLIIGAVLEKTPRTTRRLRAQGVMVRSAVQPQDVLYGRDKKSGVIAWFGTSGENNKYLWFVLTVVEHEIDGYEKLWIDGTEVDIATEIDGSGFITHDKFVDGDGNYLVKAAFYRGLDTQIADPELVAAFTDWTTDHKGIGVSYFWVRLEQDKSKGGTDPENPTANIWYKGYPRELSVTARGMKVYDPAKDSTNGGTGPHRVNTPSTWEWSQNPVLCRADYLKSQRFGPGYTSSEIDWSTIITQAAIANELVAIPGPGTQSRYELNGVITVADTPKTIIESLQAADYGTTLFNAAGVKLLVGAWDAASHTIDETWIAGSVSAVSATPTDDAYNAVRGQYLSAAADYTLVEFSPRLAPAYETEDGVGRVWEDIVLPFTSDEYMAQRLAIIRLKKSRQQTTVNIQCNFRAELIELYQIVALDLPGFNLDTFRVIGKASNTDGTTSISLRQEAESDWSYTIPELSVPPIIPSITRDPSGIPAPTSLVASSVPGGVLLAWVLPDMNDVSYIEVYASDSNDRSTALIVTRVYAESYKHTLIGGAVRYYWILARGNNGLTSKWEPVSNPDTGLDGIEGTSGDEIVDGVTWSMTNQATVIPADSSGAVSDLSNTGTDLQLTEGTAALTFTTNPSVNAGEFRIVDRSSQAPAGITLGAITGNGTDTAVAAPLAAWTDTYSLTGYIEWSVIFKKLSGGDEVPFTIRRSFAISRAGVPGAGGDDGADGTNARAVALTADNPAFVYDLNGANPSPSSAAITATALNTTGTVYYEFFLDDVAQQNTTSNIYTYTPLPSFTNMPQKAEVQIREGAPAGAILARDQLNLIGLREGADGISIILGNEAHTLPTTNTGIVNYDGSGTDIEVWEGSDKVPYDDSAPYSQPSFRVTVIEQDITAGAASTVSTYTRRYAAHSNMTAGRAVIAYTIIVNNSVGTEVTFTKFQSLAQSIEGADGVNGADGQDGSAGTNARAVNLIADDPAFEYDTNDTNPSPVNTTITATALNTTGTVYYEFFVNDAAQQNTTATTYVYTPPALFSNMPEKVEVQIREGSTVGPILARDQVTIAGLKAGANGITINMSNEAHTLPTTSAGVVEYTDSGTDILAWEGSNQLRTDNTFPYNNSSFRVTSRVGTNITYGAGPVGGAGIYTARFTDHSAMTANNATVEYEITVVNSEGVELVFTKTQSFAKSIAGDDGADGSTGVNGITWNMSNQSPGIVADSAGVVTDLSNTGTELTLMEGDTPLSFTTSAVGDGEFRVLNRTTQSPAGITLGAITGNGTDTAVAAPLAAWTDTTEMAGYIEWGVAFRRISGGATTTFTIRRSFAIIRTGSSTSPDDVDLQSVDCNAGSGTTTQQFRVHSDKTVDASTSASGVYSNQYTWLIGTKDANEYEVKLTKMLGSPGANLSSGTLDVWLNCGTTRSWVRTAANGYWKGQLSIRDVATGSVLDTAIITLDNDT